MRIVRQAEQLGIDKNAGSNGSLPSGHRVTQDGPRKVVAWDDDGDSWTKKFGTGMLSWDENGVISWVQVYNDEYKRRGIAEAMLEYARTIDPRVQHSPDLSDDGAGWASAVASVDRTAGYATEEDYVRLNSQGLSFDKVRDELVKLYPSTELQDAFKKGWSYAKKSNRKSLDAYEQQFAGKGAEWQKAFSDAWIIVSNYY